jgi:predicted nucleic-acid-binding protein
MNYCDANIILRYLLSDNEVLYVRALAILDNEQVFVPNEVLAEVVYVLTKTYAVPKQLTSQVIQQFCEKDNVTVHDKSVVGLALNYFADKNIDFVDTLLCAANHHLGVTVFSFDKKLNKCLT